MSVSPRTAVKMHILTTRPETTTALLSTRVFPRLNNLRQVVVPNMACRVIDRAIQMQGGLGVCQDTFLSEAYAHMRTLRIADGPDEVHTRSVAKYEYRRGAGMTLTSRL